MPTNYQEQQQDSYNAVAEKGIACQIIRTGSNDTPKDLSKPWLGSSDEPPRFDTYTVLIPLGGDFASASRPGVSKAIIPALGMDFRITSDMSLQIDPLNNGPIYKIEAPKELGPDPTQVILYEVQVTLWTT